MSRHFAACAAAALLAAVAFPVNAPAQEQPQEQHDHHQHRHHAAAAPAPPADPDKTEKADGLKFPAVSLLDQNGHAVDFYDDLVKGRVVAINFIFTSCTTICPPMGATFGQVQKLLGDRAGRDVHLISVSVDPATDTPERMKAWSQRFGTAGESAGWTLVTGERNEVTRLLKSLGVYTPNINDHSPLVLVGNDARGEWTRAYGLAAPAKLVELLDGMAAPAKAAAKDAKP